MVTEPTACSMCEAKLRGVFEGGFETETDEPSEDGCVEDLEDSDAICAICFEHGTFVSLPCNCKINYCSQCWDRALAASVTTRGRAQCPSCRSAFKVDFNAESGNLVFSTDHEGTLASDWRSQLYGKVKGVQIKLLRCYGEAMVSSTKAASAVAAVPCRGDRTDASPTSCSGQRSSPSTDAFVAPSCVCGAPLEHISSRLRIVRMLEDTESGWRSRVQHADDFVDRLLNSSLVTCDLCDSVAISSGAVWTCKNGPHTVMHPAAYDVCEHCFERYSGVHPGPAEGCELTGKKAFGSAFSLHLPWRNHPASIGCCHLCSAMLGALPRPWQRRRHLSSSNNPATDVSI